MPLNPVTPINPNQDSGGSSPASKSDNSAMIDKLKKKKEASNQESEAPAPSPEPETMPIQEVGDPYRVKYLNDVHLYG